jgi:hypothetical protein
MGSYLKEYLYTPNFINYFGNDCENGIPGPYLLCKIILYFFILALFFNIIQIIKTSIEILKLPKTSKFNKMFIASFITQVILIVLNIIWIYFIYNMCYLCRGWRAFFIYIVYSIIIWMLYMYILNKVGEIRNTEIRRNTEIAHPTDSRA